MKTLTYLAVFEPCPDGGYSVFFPDMPGCVSHGDTLEEAQQMAADALSLHIYGLECDNEPIPEASSIVPDEDMKGNIILPVTCNPEIFPAEKDCGDV